MPRQAKKKRFVKKGKKKTAISKTKSIVKRMINRVVETKQVVFGSLVPIVPISITTGTFFSLNIPNGRAIGNVTGSVADITRNPAQQGVGGYQHIGNKILVKRIQFYCQLYQNAPASISNNVRLMIVLDKRCQGQAPISSELLYDVGAGRSTYSPLKYNGKPTYKILFDKTYTFRNAGNITGGQTTSIPFRWSKNFPDGLITTYYPDTTATNYAGIQDNHLFALVMADEANVGIDTVMTNMLYQDA